VIVVGCVYHGYSPSGTNRTRADMSEITRERLFGFRHAFDNPLTVVLTLTALTLFLLAPVLILIVTRAANSTSDKRKELWIVIGRGSGWRCSF